MVLQTLKEIELMSALKVGMVAGGLVGVLYGLFLGIILLISSFFIAGIPGAQMAGLGAITGVIGLIGGLIGGLIIGLISGAINGTILALIYNYIIVKLVGGLKINLE